MHQPRHVPQLVQQLAQRPLQQSRRVGRQTVEFLAQPVDGKDRHAPAQFGFAENEAEHGDEEIQGSRAYHGNGVPGAQRLNEEGGIALAASRIPGRGGIETAGESRQAAAPGELGEQGFRKVAYGDQTGARHWRRPFHARVERLRSGGFSP